MTPIQAYRAASALLADMEAGDAEQAGRKTALPIDTLKERLKREVRAEGVITIRTAEILSQRYHVSMPTMRALIAQAEEAA